MALVRGALLVEALAWRGQVFAVAEEEVYEMSATSERLIAWR